MTTDERATDERATDERATDERATEAPAGPAAPASPRFPDDVISRLLRRLVRSGNLLEPHHAAGVEASLSEVFALGDLAESPGISQRELGERLGLEKSTVSRLVAGLERRGWVRRERDPSNRRFVRLHLTADGEQRCTRIATHLREQHRILLAALSPAELDALAVGLGALIRAIGQVGDHPGQEARPGPPRTEPGTAGEAAPGG